MCAFRSRKPTAFRRNDTFKQQHHRLVQSVNKLERVISAGNDLSCWLSFSCQSWLALQCFFPASSGIAFKCRCSQTTTTVLGCSCPSFCCRVPHSHLFFVYLAWLGMACFACHVMSCFALLACFFVFSTPLSCVTLLACVCVRARLAGREERSTSSCAGTRAPASHSSWPSFTR